MKYSILDFQKEFPNDDVCLEYIFNKKYPGIEGYYRVKGRKCYANTEGKQIHPLADTIFYKSSTPLTKWFLAIYLFSQSKNGVSAMELQRHLGVTYKCAWRIANKIRGLMKDDNDKLTGIVEVDETYMGDKNNQAEKFSKKSVIMGMVERGGRVKASTIEQRATHLVLGEINKNVDRNAYIMSDEAAVYKKLPKAGWHNSRIKHGKKHWVRGNVHTNTIEGFWGQFKRSVKGTYHSISRQHLQKYLDEFAFRYSHRNSPLGMFHLMMGNV